jgi:hypothetical protein
VPPCWPLTLSSANVLAITRCLLRGRWLGAVRMGQLGMPARPFRASTSDRVGRVRRIRCDPMDGSHPWKDGAKRCRAPANWSGADIGGLIRRFVLVLRLQRFMSHKMNDTTTLTIRHGHDREIKAEVIALNDDIAGQPTRVSVRVQKTMALAGVISTGLWMRLSAGLNITSTSSSAFSVAPMNIRCVPRNWENPGGSAGLNRRIWNVSRNSFGNRTWWLGSRSWPGGLEVSGLSLRFR